LPWLIILEVDSVTAESRSHRIQKFDSCGNFLTAWGLWDSWDERLEFPSGVAVDASGNVYVTDENGIKKFAPRSATPTAFTANTTAGPAPLTVRFTDESTGDQQHPTHTYTTPGTYTVNLTVSTATDSATLSRPGYITVTAPKGDFDGDGKVDIGDVSKVAYMVVGKEPADLAADFNGNGAVDIGDAAKIAYYFVGKIEAL